jgi:hypothetical protein
MIPLDSSKTAAQIINRAAGITRSTAKPDHFMNRLRAASTTASAVGLNREYRGFLHKLLDSMLT